MTYLTLIFDLEN